MGHTASKLPLVLSLDAAGNPCRWIDYEQSAYYYSKDLVAWAMGVVDYTLHGGTNAMSGRQSTLIINTIVAIKGKLSEKQLSRLNYVPLSNRMLFRRDQNLCAYCGHIFGANDLTRDHIIPSAQGGCNTWMNIVTACEACNKHKDNRTPERARMELLYVPYRPSRHEWLILSNRNILADQMEFLMKGVPKESRLYS
ncbi:MAG: HNH endonuclease [Nitrosopumilaceae archaeon]